MPNKSDNPYMNLKRIFHEPSRLAIISALSGSANGLSFNQLKSECELTDGNLSRHLKVLEEAGVVEIRKSFVGNKPRTMVYLTDSGRNDFIDYLKALEQALVLAAEAVSTEESEVSLPLSILKIAGI